MLLRACVSELHADRVVLRRTELTFCGALELYVELLPAQGVRGSPQELVKATTYTANMLVYIHV